MWKTGFPNIKLECKYKTIAGNKQEKLAGLKLKHVDIHKVKKEESIEPQGNPGLKNRRKTQGSKREFKSSWTESGKILLNALDLKKKGTNTGRCNSH